MLKSIEASCGKSEKFLVHISKMNVRNKLLKYAVTKLRIMVLVIGTRSFDGGGDPFWEQSYEKTHLLFVRVKISNSFLNRLT